MARWNRALRLLRAPRGARVLDLGCAFGFGTRILSARYAVVGVDASAGFILRAHRSVPGVPFVLARAETLPFPDQSFDAVVLLEVLEHVGDEAAVLAEVRRILRPGGELVLSVPHRGALAAWDSLNVYRQRTGRQVGFPLEEAPGGSPWHRHYAEAEIRELLAGFAIDRVERGGLGAAELANSVLLRMTLGWGSQPPASHGPGARLYQKLQGIYFVLAIAEADLPLGRSSYNLMVHAREAEGKPGSAPGAAAGS
ncbi:MAG: class I SAM-dependent methyltransferase [Chloroflexota bacterium]